MNLTYCTTVIIQSCVIVFMYGDIILTRVIVHETDKQQKNIRVIHGNMLNKFHHESQSKSQLKNESFK